MTRLRILIRKIYARLRRDILNAPGIKQGLRFMADTYERQANRKLIPKEKRGIEKGWSIIITTDGKNKDNLYPCLVSAAAELKNTPHEIIVIGPKNLKLPDGVENIKLLGYREFGIALVPGWITLKKNIGVRFSRYDRVAICHDYVTFKSGWKKGFDQFGDSFEICMNKVSNPDGSRHRDWLVWDYPGSGPTYLSYDREMTRYQYVNGTYFVVKRQFYLDNPLDEKLRWGEGEDVEWSKRIREITTFKFNPYSEVVYTKQKDDQPTWVESSKRLEEMLQKENV